MRTRSAPIAWLAGPALANAGLLRLPPTDCRSFAQWSAGAPVQAAKLSDLAQALAAFSKSSSHLCR